MSLESNLNKMSVLVADMSQLQETLLCDYNMQNSKEIEELKDRIEELEKIKTEYKKLSENEFFKNGCDGNLEAARRKLRIQIEKDCEEKYREQLEDWRNRYTKWVKLEKEKNTEISLLDEDVRRLLKCNNDKNQETEKLKKQISDHEITIEGKSQAIVKLYENIHFLEAKVYEQEQIIAAKDKTINNLKAEKDKWLKCDDKCKFLEAKMYEQEQVIDIKEKNISDLKQEITNVKDINNIKFKNMGAISYLSAAKALDKFDEQSVRVKNQLIQDALNILSLEEKNV